METDARGQLGGLDTTEEVRRRLARESMSFKCSTCARSNGDIISECEKQAEISNSATKTNVQIPSELSMGWRDEMESKNQGKGHSPDHSIIPQDSDSDLAELAEGFVKTASTNRERSDQAASSTVGHTNTSASNAETRIRSSVGGSSGRPLAQPLEQRQRQLDTVGTRGDVVPLWIDRAIVALVIVLAALVLKVLFGI